jgi:hypothetical protein
MAKLYVFICFESYHRFVDNVICFINSISMTIGSFQVTDRDSFITFVGLPSWRLFADLLRGARMYE